MELSPPSPAVPTAFADFQTSLTIPRELLRLESTYSDPPAPSDSLVVQGLRGGVTVLMVAAFEDYLEAVFREHLSRLDGAPPPMPLSRLPEKIAVTSAFTSLQRALEGPRYVETERVARLGDIRTAAQRIIDDRIDPDSISESGNNPNASAVTALFKSVGLPKIMDVLKPKYEAAVAPVASTYLRDRLNEIVRNRHVVAHTGNALNISRRDLGDWIAFLETIAGLIDWELDDLVSALLPPTTTQATALPPPHTPVVADPPATEGKVRPK